jgi:hypothetical protein
VCTATNASPAAADRMFLIQPMEGQNLQSFCKGSSAAKALTLSFWVKSNKTGTYVASLYDNDNTRHCSKSYTIVSSGVWEYKSLVFPADILGSLDNDNNDSLELLFYLMAGSTWSSGTLATSWASFTAANDAAGQTNFCSTIGNYWQVTGVQLEAGPIATPFEFEPFETTLRKCQRYYFIAYAGNSTNGIPLLRANSPNLGNRYYAIFSSPTTPRITNFTFPIIASGTQIHKPGIRWDTANTMTVDNIGSNNYYFGVNPGVDDGSSYYVIFLASVAIINNAEL